MKRFSLILLAISTLFARYDIAVGDTTWSYDQSTFQSFYMFEAITIDGQDVEETDVLGAFFNGECVGFVYANPTGDGGEGTGFTTLPLMGNDGGFPYYMSNGDTVSQVIFYDSSENSFLNLDISGTFVDENDNLEHDEGELLGQYPGWSNLEIFVLYGVSVAENTLGCTDDSSCNYDSSATADDGSCWYPVEGCSCVDDEGAELDQNYNYLDCNDVCGGSASVDNCGDCDANPNNDCIADCSSDAESCDGAYFDPNQEPFDDDNSNGTWDEGESFVDENANGIWDSGNNPACWGGTAVEDECGDCYASSNDPLWNADCTGCTDSIANNYDDEAIVSSDDCSYTVPGVLNFEATDGSGKIQLTWDAPEILNGDLGPGYYTYAIYDSSNSEIGLTNNTNYSILIEDGVDADEDGIFDDSSCYTVVARSVYGDSSPSESECANGAVVEGCYAWGIQLTASINGWGQFEETDTFNKLGAGDGKSFAYDSDCDIYEPQHGEGNYISLYFPHEEWDVWGGDHFTQDIVAYDEEFFKHNLATWDAVVESNMSGETTVNFNFFGDDIAYLEALPVYVLIDGEYISISDSTSIDFTLYASESNAKEFKVIIGNIVPQAPTVLAEGLDNSIKLTVADAENDLYPASGPIKHHIYRDGFPLHYHAEGDTSYNTSSSHFPIADGCGLLNDEAAQLDSANSVVDAADLYDTGEGLLYQSEYNYVVTSRNDAGESSEGHLVRTSGGLETFYAGRYGEDSATTLENGAPESIISHLSVSASDGEETPSADGEYTIPHNHNNDNNFITVSLDGSGSTDDDAAYNYLDTSGDTTVVRPGWEFSWLLTSEDTYNHISNETDSTGSSISFDVINPWAEYVDSNGEPVLLDGTGATETHTYSLTVTTEYPTKSDASDCAEYTVQIESHSDTSSIDVKIHPEPNAGPIAVENDALDLIVHGDGLSVLTADDFDTLNVDGEINNDFIDFDAVDQLWYEPHNNNADNNKAHLVFSALAASDQDGECDGGTVGGDDCDDLYYNWTLTTGELAGFDYTDLNDNGEFDWGEPYVVTGGDEIYENADLGDWTAVGPAAVAVDDSSSGYNGIDLDLRLNDDVYILTMKVTDEYGYSDDVSLVVGVKDERNAEPTVGDLREQGPYYIADDVDVRRIQIGGMALDTTQCAEDNLFANDTDRDNLDFVWTYSYDDDGDGNTEFDGDSPLSEDLDSLFNTFYTHSNGVDPSEWRVIDVYLSEGYHTFTFKATDDYDAMDSSEVTIAVLREPNSAPAGVVVTHTDLKYAVLEVSENSLESYQNDACYGSVYDGNLDNTQTIELYNNNNGPDEAGNTVPIKTWDKGGNNSWGETLSFIDQALQAETTYSYSVKSYNSDGKLGGSDSLSHISTTTDDRPTVTVLNPNGAEIMSVGDLLTDQFDLFNVEIQTTNPQYISKIEVFYSDGVNEVAATVSDGVNESTSVVSDNGVNSAEPFVDLNDNDAWDEGEEFTDQNNNQEYDSGGISSGNTDTTFTINVLNNVDNDNGIGNQGINYNASVRVKVSDVGNYIGGNVEFKDDDSDDPFTMASDEVIHDFDSGWSMFGSPLIPDYSIMDEAMEGPSLGVFGAEWIIYDVDGAYEDLHLTNGEGYYLALSDDNDMLIQGEAITGDPDDGPQATLSLTEGWNLIANPLVNLLNKENLEISQVSDSTNLKSWEDAVQSGWVAQTINGWFGNSHTAYDQLLPFGGYWVNTSRDVHVHFKSHLLDDGTLARTNSSEQSFTINAVDKSGDAGGDYIVLGISDESSDEFSFGEDEYDLPNPNTSSFINLHVNNIDWIGQLDANGNKANNPYFFKDMKSSDFESYQAWNISGEVYSQVEIVVELNWDASNIEDDLHLVMENETIDMKEVNSIEVSSLENMTVVLGDLDMFNNPLPEEFALGNAYPNPFNPVTQLKLNLAEDGLVNAKVYNVRGQVMAELVNGYMNAGYHMLSWDASSVASGMYMIRVESNGNIATQKVMLLK